MNERVASTFHSFYKQKGKIEIEAGKAKLIDVKMAQVSNYRYPVTKRCFWTDTFNWTPTGSRAKYVANRRPANPPESRIS